MKKVLYTCITGQYDDACAHIFVDDTWEYVMFTDNPYLLGMRRYMHWDIRPLEYKKHTNVKNARWHKINAHKLFPNYDYSLWVDGNIVIMNRDFFARINRFIDNNTKLCVPTHPVRQCIFDEAKTIKELHIDNGCTVNQEMFILRCWRYPRNNGLNETCILLRQHNAPQVRRMQRIWWRMVRNYSKRDQLAFNWAVWRCGLDVQPMFETTGEHRACDELLFVHKKTHNQNPTQNYSTWTVPPWVAKIMRVFVFPRQNRQQFMQMHSR